MKKLISVFVLTISIVYGYPQQLKRDALIVMNSPILSEVIPQNVQIEVLAKDFEWTEGPLWLSDENKLIFSDIPSNSIFEWTEENGVKLWLKPSGYTAKQERGGEIGSNGLVVSPNGKLILCQHGDRRIAEMNAELSNPKPVFETLAGTYNNKKLNSPNDAVFHQSGDIYFTDPPYGLEYNMDDPAKELDFQGIYRLSKTGKLTLLTKELSRPNGIAFSPDFKKLYVANSDPEKAIWMVYDITSDGGIEKGKIFFDATNKTSTLTGLPDGMKVHKNGWIFATGPGGILIFTPEGEHLGTIFTGEATSNCAFNKDFSELFITADDYLLRVKLN